MKRSILRLGDEGNCILTTYSPAPDWSAWTMDLREVWIYTASEIVSQVFV